MTRALTFGRLFKLSNVLPEPIWKRAGIENFRTPKLDLDSVYLNGPEVSPYLYDGYKLRLGTDVNPLDVQRIQRKELENPTTAIIGDPRNDENIIISQMQSLFIQFHNKVVDKLEAGSEFKGIPKDDDEDIFEHARRICRWVYQWIVVNEFLPAVIDPEVLNPFLKGLNTKALPGPINWTEAPFISVEFSGAAFRFGHSFVRQNYRLNDSVSGDLFDFDSFKFIPRRNNIKWKYLFNIDGRSFLKAKKIDTLLARDLFTLPFIENDDVNLASRNLIRGQLTFMLPTGEALAKELGFDAIPLHPFVKAAGLEKTPLWFYILAEAEYKDGKLGDLGGSLVAGTLLRMLILDEESYINLNPDFDPHTVFRSGPESMFAKLALFIA